MGFRNRRRRGGGGGGGQHHHGFFGGEAHGMNPGDDVGNRKSFKPVQHVPEDLGNRRDPDEAEWVPEDDVGNRVFEAPTHELSGTLLDLDGKRRRRRPKGVSAPERIGRFLVGGVNPLVAGGLPRPGLEAAHQAFEAAHAQQQEEERGERPVRDDRRDDRRDGRDGRDGRGGAQPQRQRRFESPDGAAAAHDVSDRRAQRFFDFAEDDRFEYTLKSTPEQKRKESEDIVAAIVKESGRDATVVAKLLEDGTRPKVLVCIDERGPAADLPPERRAPGAGDPLFMLGNGALMSLNYIANKVVNRYPDDRIRLAVLPASDEKLYMESLAEHQRTRAPQPPRHDAAKPADAKPADATPHAANADATPHAAKPAAAPAPVAQKVEAADATDDTEEIVTAAASEETIEAAPASAAPDAHDGADAAPRKKAAPKKAAAKSAKKADDDDAPKKKAAAKSAKKADDDDDKKKPAKRPVKKSAPAVDRVVLKR